jgi:aromatic ring-opening dioxygenase catalytic subunit (LigB family)
VDIGQREGFLFLAPGKILHRFSKARPRKGKTAQNAQFFGQPYGPCAPKGNFNNRKKG